MNMAVNVKRLNETIDVRRAEAESDRQRSVSRRTQALLAAAGMDGQKRWAILKVEPRRENDVDKALCAALIDHWLPLRRADENYDGRRRGAAGQPIWVLAWPCYIFVHVVDTPKAWAGLATIKHVKSVLGVGERPFLFDDEIVLRIKAELATLKNADQLSGLLPAPGEKVLVKDGPFASFPATVVESIMDDKGGRARVEVGIFGREVPIELSLAQLARA
jgi:transcription termination/antitermination protein NusG